MNDTQTSNETETKAPATSPVGVIEEKTTAVVHALRDVGATWADVGIGIGRVALENSARALGRTAKLLETLQEQLKRGEEHGKREEDRPAV
jgi:hypothetical protein